jgi:hypothetical protein
MSTALNQKLNSIQKPLFVEFAQLSKASVIIKTQTILALIVNQLLILVAANITIGVWR